MKYRSDVGPPGAWGNIVHILKDIALNRWTWLAVALVGALVALFVYASSRQQQEIRSIVQAAADEEASYMLGNLSDRLTFIASDLLDMSSRVPHQSQSGHLASTKHLIQANPFLQAINHIGVDRRIEYVAPFEPNKQVVGLKIEIPAPKEALLMAASSQRPYLSRPFEIIQGEVGYSMMVPDLDGRFFEIVSRGDAVFGDQSPFRRRLDIAIQAFDGEISVFESPDYEDKLSETRRYEVGVEGAVLNRALRIDALPGYALLARSSDIWRIIATGSLVLSFVSLSAIIATQAFNIRRRQRAEEHARRLSLENEVLAEIGRIITSSLDIDEVYERFGEHVRHLIPFDRIDIVTVDLERNEIRVEYVYGIEVDARTARRGYTRPLAGSIVEEVVRRGTGILNVPRDRDELARESPRALPSYDLGLLSRISSPLIVAGKGIGMLALMSRKPQAYTKDDLRLVGRVCAQIAGAIANARLYSELHRAGDALRESEERYRLLVELSPDPIWLHSDSRVVYANAAAARLYSAAGPEELVGRSFLEIVSEEDHALARERMRRLYHDGLPTQPTEMKAVGVDGRVRIVETRGVPIRHLGRPAAIVVQRDITERKELQAQLIQSQKMEAVGQLAGGVAHEFNNLLTAILGYAHILKDTLSSDHHGHDYVDEINAAADRAATITRQLLAFSRRETAEPRVVDLNDCVLNTTRLMRRLLGENIELVTPPSREPGMVRVDQGQMEQVLVNMAVNARDAMPAGGRLTIETMGVTLGSDSAVQLSELPPGRYVKLAISDTGVGMSEEVKARLFEPFFTTKEVGKGTGLGLATCHGIVRQSGGDIRVVSEPGRGSTFEVYLPQVAKEGAEGANGGETGAATKGTETVLVVEDEPSVRRLTVSVLRRQGYTVLEASEGEEALQVAREFGGENIHVLLTDVVMPRMNGSELADSLLAQFPETKVIFTSGYPEDTLAQDSGFRSDFAFLLKPFVPAAVAAKVREVLDAPC